MKRKRNLVIFATILLSLGLGLAAYWQSQRPLDFYYDGHSYTHRRFAAAPLSFASLEELQDAHLHPVPDERFLFTLAANLNFQQFGQVLNDYAASGLGGSIRWRIENGQETRYDFPPYCGDDVRNTLDPGAEYLSMAKIPGTTACLLVISLREQGLFLNDNPITLQELSIAVQRITQGEQIDLRCLDLIVPEPEETSLKSAQALFDWIATQKWNYLVWIETPLDPTDPPLLTTGFLQEQMGGKSNRYRDGFRPRPPLPNPRGNDHRESATPN